MQTVRYPCFLPFSFSSSVDGLQFSLRIACVTPLVRVPNSSGLRSDRTSPVLGSLSKTVRALSRIADMVTPFRSRTTDSSFDPAVPLTALASHPAPKRLTGAATPVCEERHAIILRGRLGPSKGNPGRG